MQDMIFPYGRPVTGKHLVGRKKEIEVILSLIRNGQSVMLAAPRRMGKTSILLEALRRLKREGWFVGSVDVFSAPTLVDLSQMIVKTTLENRGISGERIIRAAREGIDRLRRAVELKHVAEEGYEIVLSFAGDTRKPMELLDEALDFPDAFASKHKKRMCFAYDEFGDIKKMDVDLIKKMRAKFQKHQSTAYIFCGSQESIMSQLFQDKKQAFYGFATPVEIPPIPKDVFARYIGRTFSRENIKSPSHVISRILEITDGHPYYTQFLCQVLYYQVRGRHKEISTKEVDRAFDEAMLMQQSYLDGLWSSLSRAAPLQLAICRLIASEEGASPYIELNDTKQNIYYGLSSLLKKGILRKVGERYTMVDPFFSEYLRRKS
ncbi:MAG: ATP-binding protein [Thermoplasmata archaeon]